MFANPTFNVPNLLTFLRILLVPVFVGLIMDRNYTAATVVFVVAGLSDALDGFIAKRFTQRTEFGAWLDPFADKFLLLSAFVVLAVTGWIPAYLCALVILRDVVIVGGIVILRRSGKTVQIAPTISGKLTTTAQIITVIYSLIAHGEPGTFFTALILVTALLTVYSGVEYVRREARVQKLAAGANGSDE